MNKLSHHPRFKALQYMFSSSLLTFSLNNLMIGWTIATFLILVKVEKNITRPSSSFRSKCHRLFNKEVHTSFCCCSIWSTLQKGNDKLNTFNPQQISIKHATSHAFPPNPSPISNQQIPCLLNQRFYKTGVL